MSVAALSQTARTKPITFLKLTRKISQQPISSAFCYDVIFRVLISLETCLNVGKKWFSPFLDKIKNLLKCSFQSLQISAYLQISTSLQLRGLNVPECSQNCHSWRKMIV